MRVRWPALFAALIFLFGLPVQGQAQTAEPKRSPFGIAAPTDAGARGLTAGRPAAPETAAPVGYFDRAWAWVLEKQQIFRREMNAAVARMKAEPFGAGFLIVVLASFAYGVLHAVGPGHGKGVISSYVLASSEAVRRGVFLAFLSAVVQAISAVSIFAVLNLLLNARKQDFDTVESWLATISWALVAVFGAWLVWRQVRSFLAKVAAEPAGARARSHGPAHGHHHAHAEGHRAHEHPRHHHAHEDACECGHAHVPSPRELAGPWSWRRAIALAVTVGIRPCTGALGVLALTTLNGLFWAGVAATFAMALGTAITTATIVALAAGSRDLAVRFTGGDGLWAGRVASAAGLAGAVALFVLGATFFLASLRGAGPI